MPSKIPTGKRQLNVLIHEDLYKRLLEVSTSKYGKAHGALSATVEEALLVYFEHLEKTGGVETPQPQHIHRHDTRSSKLSRKLLGDQRVYDTYQQVIALLREMKNVKDSELICEIHEHEIANIIKRIRGGDPRTIERWIKDFLDYGLMTVIEKTPRGRVFWDVKSCGKPD